MNTSSKELWSKLQKMISDAFDAKLNSEDVRSSQTENDVTNTVPLTPEEYKERTGKRFRMTKEQKERGLTRNEAYEEFMVSDTILEIINAS